MPLASCALKDCRGCANPPISTAIFPFMDKRVFLLLLYTTSGTPPPYMAPNYVHSPEFHVTACGTPGD